MILSCQPLLYIKAAILLALFATDYTAAWTLNHKANLSRRHFLTTVTVTTLLLPPQSTLAKEEAAFDSDNNSVYTKQALPRYAYTFTPPPSTKQTGKPLKTHLDEVNFVYTSPVVADTSTDIKVNIGITVDPVRINSLQQFGTPEQIAAKVVLAEVNRDGVFDVMLLKDPEYKAKDNHNSSNNEYILLEYLSSGKRGEKHIFDKIIIQNQHLYVLSLQVKQEMYKSGGETLQSTIRQAIDSFTVTV